MDTRTGEIKPLEHIKPEEKKHFVKLTPKQARKLRKVEASRRVEELAFLKTVDLRREKNKAARRARKKNRGR